VVLDNFADLCDYGGAAISSPFSCTAAIPSNEQQGKKLDFLRQAMAPFLPGSGPLMHKRSFLKGLSASALLFAWNHEPTPHDAGLAR
jgi:hypothetical protein